MIVMTATMLSSWCLSVAVASSAHWSGESSDHGRHEELVLLQRLRTHESAAMREDHRDGDATPWWDSVCKSAFLPPWACKGTLAKEVFDREVGSAKRAKLDDESLQPRYWNALADNFATPSSPLYLKRFQQKYYTDCTSHKKGGPVFFELGGEGPVRSAPKGWMKELAEKYGAMLVQVEHRFYGDSVPFDSVNTSVLKLLTVDQALADYAGFIEWYRVSHNLPCQIDPDSKWFIFGGSYPGALASWFRIKYPNLSVGSLSSSGVVNSIFDFFMFDAHIAHAIGAECAQAHRKVTATFEKYILERGEHEALAKSFFGITGSMLDGDFFYMLADGLAMTVQYGKKSLLCANLTGMDPDASEVDIMKNSAALIKSVWGNDFGTSCFYDTSCLSDPARYTVGATDRSWRWQKCYELAYLQSAPLQGQSHGGAPMQPALRSFMVNMTYMVNQCYEIFGQDIFSNTPADAGAVEFATNAINAKLGGAQPTATNVFYSNFADDPWMEASVMPPRDVDASQPYALANCDDCGHCNDLHAPSDDDPAELKAVRRRFVDYLDAWLTASADRDAALTSVES
eukprot:TRINITY_DN17317_c0_g2_i2.p1 TRINITY_DN17317_c0_g2~~TRINITY_DN17317_c0_g2_i2.p1  ORF type:complete len:589 (-),score=94.70 TRINITY_DN17317_c0_g2_i2:74-1783(-)